MLRLAILLTALPVLAACGATADESAPRAAFGPLLAKLPAPAAGSLRTADGSASFVVRGNTLVRIDGRTGTEAGTIALPGRWALGGVSADGRFVALVRPGTRVLVVDVDGRRIAHRLELPGRFRVETISVGGDFLFLQQDFVDGSYAVRGYDLAAGRLLPGSLGTKGKTVKMQGRPGQVVASPDGKWLLTLYVDTRTNTAFVHALDLIARDPNCLVLPPCDGCAPNRWKLRLAADGRTLRATNAGEVAVFRL